MYSRVRRRDAVRFRAWDVLGRTLFTFDVRHSAFVPQEQTTWYQGISGYCLEPRLWNPTLGLSVSAMAPRLHVVKSRLSTQDVTSLTTHK